MTAVSTASADTRYEASTEGLRGLCALMVLYTHLLAPFRHLDPGYAPSNVFWWIEAGQGAVLLFFVLSGYVIGLTNQKTFNRRAAANYGWRRAIRIVPLYLIAVLLSYAVRPVDSWATLAGNLAFLQNDVPIGGWHVPLLSGNTNLWSLNYEVLYYALFLAVWIRPKLWPVWLVGASVLGAAIWRVPTVGDALSTYASGWVFWLAGYGLARAPRVADDKQARLPWPSLLLVWLATWHLKPLWWFAHRYGLLPDNSAWMNYSFCDFLPSCVAVLMAASGRRPRAFRWIANFSLVLALAFSIWRLAHGRASLFSGMSYDLVVFIAAALWWWRPSGASFVRLAPVGMISYAIYIFQRPVQWCVLDYLRLPAGTPFSFALRVIVAAGLTIAVAYLAERKLQPTLRRWLQPSPRPAQPEPVAVG